MSEQAITGVDLAELNGRLREAHSLCEYYQQRNTQLSAAVDRLSVQVEELTARLQEYEPPEEGEATVPNRAARRRAAASKN